MQPVHSPALAALSLCTLAATGIATLAGPALFASSPPAAVADDPILAVWPYSLTTLEVAAATPVQDVRPLVGQRATNLDGMLRARPMQAGGRLAVGGNPFENVWRAASVNAMRLDTGTYQLEDVDLSLPAVMPWTIGRTYNARQETSGAAHRDSDGPNGRNFFQTSQPEILFHDDASGAAEDLLYVMLGADRFVEYQRTDGSSSTFRSRNGSAGIVSYTAPAGGDPELYTLVDQHGTEITFFGFDGNATPAEGQIWKIVDADNNTAFVGDTSSASTAITNGYTASGRISKAFDSADRRFSYTYDVSTDRLTQVIAETKSGGTWASPTGVAEVGRVNYEYYGNESYGDLGALKLVEVTTPLSESGISSVAKRYYRYWEGTFNASTNPGHPFGLMFVVDSEGLRSQDWADQDFDEDFLALSNASLEPYATAYFEYEANHRVNMAWFNGECGCSGGTNGTYLFEFETNGSFSDDPDAFDEEWKTRTVVERPNGSYLTQYFDEAHQPLTQVVTDADPDNTGPAPSRWVTHVTRDANGQVASLSTPANVTGYTHSTGAVTTSSSVGLVWNYTRSGSGVRRGFITEVKWREGTSGTAYFDREFDYTNASLAVGADSNLIRPFLSTLHAYSTYKSTSTGDRITTTMTPTLYSGEVVPEKITITYPVVGTSTNGPNSATSRTQYFDKDGSLTWEKAEDGIIAYREYTNGQVTKAIEDADTGETGSGEDFETVTIPTGLASTGGALHRKSTFVYDAQGRQKTATEADGRVFERYVSKLADGRLVSLAYNDFETGGTPKYFGPVNYMVSNLAGKSEFDATVALSNNESTLALSSHVDEAEADPLEAIGLGTVVRLSTSIYNETGGTAQESRLYHDIPASGAGSDGTNYDATLYGYDPLGERWRTKAPHGTISRSVHDIHGRTIERWVGANDSSFDGGEPSGTDNMVKVETLEFDGGADDGNGYLTERTLFVEDSGTGSRVTTYSYDALGNVLLETRPVAPHAFHKVDAMGRTIATGLYSATGSITLGTDDPTSETTNRLALSQTFYDPKGQVWKTKRHKIDAADGSDDDSLDALTWYDATGRTIKEDGSQLTKAAYDRLGRQTHSFILADARNSGGSTETAYADADDVAHDIVLEEHQTVYESSVSDDVVMNLSIARHWDDADTGQTLGALDTNADGDNFLVTPANIEGRPSIAATWHDRFGRVIDTVQYGTYSGASFDRDALTVPSRSDTALLTENTWAIDGSLQDVIDPKALVRRSLYDDAGRTVATIENYVDGTPSGVTGDDDVYTRFTYIDGLRTELWVDLDGDGTQDGTDQVTTYTFGTVKGGSAGDSKIATGHLLQEVAYPDSSSASDVVSFAYNAQSQEIWKEDQAGNVFESEYDTAGRRTKLKVTNLAGGFDGAVRRIESAFTSLGQALTVTSYDAATSGTAVNEVKYGYDGWGNVSSFKQDKDGTVGGSGFYEVAYTWAKATTGRNTIRKDEATLPSGATLEYRYLDGARRFDNLTSRVTEILHGATSTVRYAYNGLGQVVGTDYPQPEVISNLSGSTSGSYPGLDLFGRVVASTWASDLTTPIDFFHVDIAYDRNSNITRVEDQVHAGFDVVYAMDDLDRLDRAERGTWGGSSISSQQEDQTWTLDQVGNWDQVTLDFNADNVYTGTDEHNDDRTHNTVNELTGRDVDDSGTDDYTLVYDAVGNLTDDGEDYEYVYDPLGRLRKVLDQSSALVAEYKYNGLGHMIAVHVDTDLDLDVDGSDLWYYPVHDERWRMVANFRGNDASPKEEWVPQEAGLDGRGGSSYINGVVLRDKDANTAWTSASDGTLEERIYLCQNWRGDVSALVRSNGDQVEQVRYSPYGAPFGLPGGDTDSNGDCDAGDVTQIQAWIDAPVYDVRGDVDLDGDVDASDKAIIAGVFEGTSMGPDTLSQPSAANTVGYEGHRSIRSLPSLISSRNRTLNKSLGRWTSRDKLEYIDGQNLYEHLRSRPPTLTDPSGLLSVPGNMAIKPFGNAGRTLFGCPGCIFVRSEALGPSTKTSHSGNCFLTLAAHSYVKADGHCTPFPYCDDVESPCSATWTVTYEIICSGLSGPVSLDTAGSSYGHPGTHIGLSSVSGGAEQVVLFGECSGDLFTGYITLNHQHPVLGHEILLSIAIVTRCTTCNQTEFDR